LYRTLPESQLERTLDQQLIKLELEFSTSNPARSQPAGLEYGDSDRNFSALELEVDHDTASSPELLQDSTTSEEPSIYAEPTAPEVIISVSEATCLEGVESTLDVMMPDRFVNSQV